MIEAEHAEICIDGKSVAKVGIDPDEEEAKFVRRCTAFRLELLKEKSDLSEPTKTTQAEHD